MNSEPGRDSLGTNADDTGQGRAEYASRREALARLGRFAYVAPALTLLAEPRLAHAAYGLQQAGNGSGSQNHGHRHGHHHSHDGGLLG